MIRVLLVDDSPIALAVIRKMLAGAADILVVGSAANGKDALKLIPALQPQVICTDLHMPVMDGLQFTREVMAHHPLPILVVSVSVQTSDDHITFRLLEAGAIDVFPKPRGGLEGNPDAAMVRELVGKIRILAGVVPIRRHRRSSQRGDTGTFPTLLDRHRPIRMIAIGASTGGPQALLKILSALPVTLPAAILCIQHISSGFLGEMIEWLQSHTRLKVEIARFGATPQPGCLYFPPEDQHLTIDRLGRFDTLNGESTEYFGMASPWHCPSIDVAFHAVAQHYREESMGILLTGMGRDGAEGLKVIATNGGITVAQDEESCIVFGMPKQAIELGAVQHVLALNRIGEFIVTTVLRTHTSA